MKSRSWFHKVLLVAFPILVSCGPDKDSKENLRSSDPCEVRLRYTETGANGPRDVVRYDSHSVSESCSSYIGENVRRLNYRVIAKAKPSVGYPGFIHVSGQNISLRHFSLADGDIDIQGFDKKSWTGPLGNLDAVYMIFGFPRDTEKSLYPTEVKLIITCE